MLIAIIATLFLSKCLSSGMKRHVASQNLDLAMLVVQKLQEKYQSARFVFAYYTTAFERVAPSQKASTGHAPLQSPKMTHKTPTSCEGRAKSRMLDTSYDPLTTSSSGQEYSLDTWEDVFPDTLSADFEFLFGAEGIFRGLEEFDIDDMVA